MIRIRSRQVIVLFLGALLLLQATTQAADRRTSFASVIDQVQPKIVKIYGAGGIRGLEAYQSGFLISSEGHVLTVWSYVLDTEYINVVLDDGRKFQAEMLGADPRLEIAVLKIDANELPYFPIDDSSRLASGARVLAFSNLYGIAMGDEPASVLHGSVSATTNLSARRGAYKTNHQGPVYVLDAMTNNAGSAGGALTDRRGRLKGLLGKELRNDQNNTWLNYAIPISEIRSSSQQIMAGEFRPRSEDETVKRPAEPMTIELVGLVMIPNVLNKTPPFVEQVVRGSAAEKVGIQPDDLVLFVGDRMVQSRKSFEDELGLVDRIDSVRITILRNQELLDVELSID